MKKSIKLFSLLTIFAVTFAACGKDDSADPDNNNNGGNANKEFAVTVDGKTWSNITTTATKNSVGKIFIQATMGEESVILAMPDDITTGTYTLAGSTYTGTYKETELSDAENSLSGELKITKHDTDAKKLEGTFNFTSKVVTQQSSPTTEITGGSFSVTYTVQ